ncbi:MAG: hypothetical protein PsegKO_23950 [Pseudohongiellaceae bacterium]|jgi:hypothetical protein
MNTVRIIFIATTLSIGCIDANAQQSHPEYPAVQQVVDYFFESINTGNGALLAGLEVDGAQVLNIREDVPGDYEFVERAWFGEDSFSDGARLTERYWDEQLLISDHLAVFWAPYDLHVDGEFSHCGIDVLNLIKIDEQWKIGHAMWTIQRQGCAASPLGPLEQ